MWELTSEQVKTISIVVTAGLSLATIYFGRYFYKFRQLRDLALAFINALDDHKLTEEEVKDLSERLKELIFKKDE
jgi:hypothetical protein